MRFVYVLTAALALSACGGEDEPVAVSINVKGVVGSEPFQCGRSYSGVGATSAEITPVDFRFYVHNVRVITEDGDVAVTLDQNASQYKDVALLDFEDGAGECADGDAETNTVITGQVPDRKITGVKLSLGLPMEINHAQLDSLPSPVNKSSMYWDWMGGHIFLVATSQAGTMNHFTHVGSTACEGDPANNVPVASCDRPNRREYVFESFDPATQSVRADFKAIKAGVDVTASGGCHSFTEASCSGMFSNLGIDWSSGQAKTEQTVFSVE